MTQKIERLKELVDSSPLVIEEYKTKVLLYLSVVLLGCNFGFLAKHFKKEEEKIRNSVTAFAVKFKKNRKIQGVMFRITRDFNNQQSFNF